VLKPMLTPFGKNRVFFHQHQKLRKNPYFSRLSANTKNSQKKFACKSCQFKKYLQRVKSFSQHGDKGSITSTDSVDNLWDKLTITRPMRQLMRAGGGCCFFVRPNAGLIWPVLPSFPVQQLLFDTYPPAKATQPATLRQHPMAGNNTGQWIGTHGITHRLRCAGFTDGNRKLLIGTGCTQRNAQQGLPHRLLKRRAAHPGSKHTAAVTAPQRLHHRSGNGIVALPERLRPLLL